MRDAVTEDITNLFRGVRPQLVVEKASVDNALPQDLQTEHVLNQITGTTVEMSNKFVIQPLAKSCILAM